MAQRPSTLTTRAGLELGVLGQTESEKLFRWLWLDAGKIHPNRRSRPVAPGRDTGPRRSEETVNFVKFLAHGKPDKHYTSLLTGAALQTFAASLFDDDCANLTNVEGNDPPLSQLLVEALQPHSPSHSQNLAASQPLVRELLAWIWRPHNFVCPNAWRLISSKVQHPPKFTEPRPRSGLHATQNRSIRYVRWTKLNQVALCRAYFNERSAMLIPNPSPQASVPAVGLKLYVRMKMWAINSICCSQAPS